MTYADVRAELLAGWPVPSHRTAHAHNALSTPVHRRIDDQKSRMACMHPPVLALGEHGELAGPAVRAHRLPLSGGAAGRAELARRLAGLVGPVAALAGVAVQQVHGIRGVPPDLACTHARIAHADTRISAMEAQGRATNWSEPDPEERRRVTLTERADLVGGVDILSHSAVRHSEFDLLRRLQSPRGQLHLRLQRSNPAVKTNQPIHLRPGDQGERPYIDSADAGGDLFDSEIVRDDEDALRHRADRLTDKGALVRHEGHHGAVVRLHDVVVIVNDL